MAMNVGPSSGDGDVIMDINTTPLIDVMLVLLIMFIITIPIQTHAVKMNMPIPSKAAPPPKPPVIIRIDVDFDGTIGWNGEIVPDRSTLESRLQQVAAEPDQPEVQIRGDGRADYDSVGRIIYACQRAGIAKVGFITEPPVRGG